MSSAPQLLGWAEELKSVVTDRFLGRVCGEAGALDAGATPEEMMQVEVFLGERRQNIKRLLYDHRNEFTAINEVDWGMEL